MTQSTGFLDRLAYDTAQRMRVAWYTGHYAAARRLSAAARRDDPAPTKPARRKSSDLPSRRDLMSEMGALFEQEWRHIAAGTYGLPHNLFANPLAMLDLSRQFFRDLPKVEQRRAGNQVFEIVTPDRRDIYPAYYLQNFHHQTDGYLSKDSARIYDFQAEILFTGAAGAMRRQALVPLYHCLKRRDQRKLKLLDVACGTGGFLTFVKDNYPRLSITGVDLSPDYLAEARRSLEKWRGVDLVRSNAEAMPFDGESYDVVTCSYLFHELPPRVRPTVAGEMVRLLKPGGTLIFVDTLQIGDRPEFDALLDMFPENFHEPYYASYIASGVKALFKDTPVAHKDDALAFLSKISVFEKPCAI